MPGLVVGAYAGNRLGAVRDAKGKSVAAVFAELGAAQKAEVSRKTPMSRSPYLHFDYDLLTDLARARFEGVRYGLQLSPDDGDTMHGMDLFILCDCVSDEVDGYVRYIISTRVRCLDGTRCSDT